MKQRKAILTLAISLLMILSLVAVMPMATAANPCSVRGYVYVDDVATEPDQVILSFTGEDPIPADNIYSDGFYIITEDMPAGETGIFYVTILEGTWQAAETVIVESGVYLYRENLTINTSLPPIDPPSDDDDDDASDDDDDDASDDDDDDSAPPPAGDDDDDDFFPGGGDTVLDADASSSETSGFVGESLNFDGSLSIGSITSYTWDFDDGSTGTGETTTHTYATDGIYTVTLTVSDGTNTDDDPIDVVIVVGNREPTKPTVTGEPTGSSNTEYTCSAMSTDLDNDTIKYSFVWGDGETTTTELLPNGTITEQKHTYAGAGKYTIQVTANDNSTDSATATYSVLIDAIDLEYNETYVGYMTDDDGDGTWDKFHATGVETDVELQEDGTYLIDSDGDGEPDYVYDPNTGELTLYTAETSVELDNSVWLMLGVGLILAVIVVGGIAFFMKKKK